MRTAEESFKRKFLAFTKDNQCELQLTLSRSYLGMKLFSVCALFEHISSDSVSVQ